MLKKCLNKVIPAVSAIISVTTAITVIMTTTPVPAAVMVVVPAVTATLLVGIVVIRVGLPPGVHTLKYKSIKYVQLCSQSQVAEKYTK